MGGSHELQTMEVKLKATSAILKGDPSPASALFRRGSRRLSNEGVDDAMQSKHAEEIKKAGLLRSRLKAHHEEARTVLAKKLQVENARRVLPSNFGRSSEVICTACLPPFRCTQQQGLYQKLRLVSCGCIASMHESLRKNQLQSISIGVS